MGYFRVSMLGHQLFTINNMAEGMKCNISKYVDDMNMVLRVVI